MPFVLKYDMNRGTSLIEASVTDEKELFQAGNFLSQLPRFCPFDGFPTRLHYSQDDKGQEYFGVCSINNERIKFKFGQRREADKRLYPYGWTYWEDIDQGNGQSKRYTWHWIGNAWRQYDYPKGADPKKASKEVLMDKIRNKMFPTLDPLLPTYGDPFSSDLDEGEYSEALEEKATTPATTPATTQATTPATTQATTQADGNKEVKKRVLNSSGALAPERVGLEKAIEEICNLGGETDIAIATPWIVDQWTRTHQPTTNRIDSLTNEEMVAMTGDIIRLKARTREAFRAYKANLSKSTGK